MTVQGTPTPTEELTAILRGARTMGVTGEMDVTFQDAGAALRAAGWKSPAEVSELVRAAAYESWNVGVGAGINRMASPTSYFLVNPHTQGPSGVEQP